MQILRTKRTDNCCSHVIIVFGMGLIGSNIYKQLVTHHCRYFKHIPFAWHSRASRNKAFDKLQAILNEIFPEKLSIIWSAGRSTFGSSTTEMSEEHEPFLELNNFIQKFRQTCPGMDLSFHFISSAGGLFERQRIIEKHSVPFPVRPYGKLKLHQEKILLDSLNHSEVKIYRPSSVYGPMQQVQQKGLINNLVCNARVKKTTVLDANIMVLRDYVFAGDIGNYVAKRVLFSDPFSTEKPIKFLVSGRCTSIFEVVRKIESVLKLKVYLKIDESFGNSSNITFGASVLPADWFTSPLSVGIRQFLMNRQHYQKTFHY